MSDETLSVPSFLDEDLSKVDTRSPVIRASLTEEVEIISVEVASKEENGQKTQTLKIAVKTLKDLPGTKGETVNAGFPLYTNIGLTPLIGRPDKKDWPEDSIKKEVAKFVQAVGVPTLMPVSQFAGKRVIIKTSVTPAKDQWPEKNGISFIKQG